MFLHERTSTPRPKSPSPGTGRDRLLHPAQALRRDDVVGAVGVGGKVKAEKAVSASRVVDQIRRTGSMQRGTHSGDCMVNTVGAVDGAGVVTVRVLDAEDLAPVERRGVGQSERAEDEVLHSGVGIRFWSGNLDRDGRAG